VMEQQVETDSTKQPANAAEGGREINKRVLHVGGVDQNVTEDMLMELFRVTGNVVSIKILPEKSIQRKGFNYAFVEYEKECEAELAMHTLNRRMLNQSEIKINWAYHTQQAIKDSENYTNIFVGDLSQEVNDESLTKAFSKFGSLVEARVMWDMTTGRSRSYGFASFRDPKDAERAIHEMDGELIGSRPIRCNWAQQKTKPSNNSNNSINSNGNGYNTRHHHRHQPPPPHPMPYSMSPPPPPHFPPNGVPTHHPNYDMILHQAPSWVTTVYIGNLSPYTNTNELVHVAQNFGYVVDFKHQQEKGYAFAKYDSHERAAMAIYHLSAYQINGRWLKCGWGKDTAGNNNNSRSYRY
jgi:nucleolysin TIA-1/TIAR